MWQGGREDTGAHTEQTRKRNREESGCVFGWGRSGEKVNKEDKEGEVKHR